MRKNEENMTWMDIPYITLTFCLRFYQRVAVPENKVSALRGGLGEMLLRKNCIADRDCEACRFQDNCMVWNAFYTPMRLKPGYVTGKESLGYLIECDNLDTVMDEGHGFVFRLKLFGRNIPLFAQYLDAFWRLGQCGLGKEQAKFEIAAVYRKKNSCFWMIQRSIWNISGYTRSESISGRENGNFRENSRRRTAIIWSIS